MTVNIPPTILPTRKPNRQRFRRPWQTDPSCVLCLMPEIDTQWRDYSGIGNHGTLDGPTKMHNCRYGEGLFFDVTDDLVDCGNNSSLDVTTNATFEVWIYALGWGPTSYGRILSKEKNVAYSFALEGPGAGLRVHLGGVGYSSTPDIISLNRWYHVAASFDSALARDNIKYYTDGRPGGTSNHAVAIPVTVEPLIIGNWSDKTRTFDGYIDEVRIYNRTLGPEEINALFEAGRPYEA